MIVNVKNPDAFDDAGSEKKEITPDDIGLPTDWPYLVLGGSSILEIDPLISCLKKAHPGWCLVNIMTGNSVDQEWIKKHLEPGDGWDKRVRDLRRCNVIVLLAKLSEAKLQLVQQGGA